MATSPQAIIPPAGFKLEDDPVPPAGFTLEPHVSGQGLAPLPVSKNTPAPGSVGAITNAGKNIPTDKGYMDQLIDLVRPVAAGAAATAGAAAGAPLDPFTFGGASVAGGAGGYALVDALLQHLKSKPSQGLASHELGLRPGSAADTLTNSGEQFLLGKIAEAAVGTGVKVVKSLNTSNVPEIYKFLPTTSQAASAIGKDQTDSLGLKIIGSGAKILEDMNMSSKAKALDRTAGAGFTQALSLANDEGFNYSKNPQTMLGLINKDNPTNFNPQQYLQNPSTYKNITPLDNFSKIDKVIADPEKLQDTLTAAQSNGVGDNLKKSLQGYQFMKMFNDAATRDVEGNVYTDRVTKINPATIASEWLDPKMQDSLKLLYNKDTRSNIEQFFKNVAETQDKPTSLPYSKFWILHGGVGFGAGLLTSVLTGSELSGAAAAGGGIVGMYVGANLIGRMLSNPKVARTVVAMAGGEPLTQGEQLAAKMIVRSLQGATVALINKDGSRTPGYIDKDSKFIPLSSQQQGQ